jgi:hypothetical protein
MSSYEAYVLYIFMQLLIHFLGGENSLIVHLEFKVCQIMRQKYRGESSSRGLWTG